MNDPEVIACGFSVLVDETTDSKGKCPIVVMFQPLNSHTFPAPLIGGFYHELTNDERGTNNVDIQQVIFETCSDIGIPLRSIRNMTIDGAGYMKPAVENIQRFYPMILFIWCFCHMLNRLLVTVSSLSEFADVSSLMTNLV